MGLPRIGGALLGLLLLVPPAVAFDLQGHRGARGLAPENTLAAFATALSLGVSTLELDTGITKDGVVVIAHDQALNPNLARDRSGRWLAQRGPTICSLTYAELSEYDVGRIKPGTDYARQQPDQVPADGSRIPRLVDLFALVRKAGNASVRFNIETKLSPLLPDEAPDPERFAGTLVELLRQEGMASRVSIQSFDWRTLRVVQRIAPEIPTVYLSSQQRFLDTILADRTDGSPWTAGLVYREHGSVARMVKTAGGRIWSPSFGDLTAERLREAHALGIAVVVWTVNDPVQIARMLDLGVDGIISDRPDLVRELLARRGLPLPPPTPVTP
jgi:glycerophosphoryl diester phosphodiesterase